ncbi:MAG: MFS transporter [Hyphomicrobiaceae bacterium]|nr:MFS transporter [Hyphomicrobiaceae bacterium]
MRSMSFIGIPNPRNVTLLAICQGFFMSVQSMAIATTPLAGHALLGVDKTLATFPLFMTHAGVMLTTVPASFLMAWIGRRGGFTVGALCGVASGAISVAAIYLQSFPLLCLGALFQGMAGAFAWYFRFAAADATEPGLRAKAISLVMLGGVIAGFLGPQTAKWAVHWLDPLVFAGVYVMAAVFSLLVMLLVQGLRIPPLSAAEKAEGGRPMGVIVRQPAYVVALASSMFGYGVMTLVMSATPLAMLACGFEFNDSATVIQAHVIAMFLPSFFTGHLITRFGVLPVIASGALIQMLCAITNLAGIGFWNFFLANALVGLGWNFTFVGGTTLLTATYAPAERAKVQASHDFAVYAVTATAAGMSGILQANVGWTVVNVAALPLMATVLLAALWLRRHQSSSGGRALRV